MQSSKKKLDKAMIRHVNSAIVIFHGMQADRMTTKLCQYMLLVLFLILNSCFKSV